MQSNDRPISPDGFPGSNLRIPMPATKPVVNHSFNMVNKLTAVQVALARSPTGMLQGASQLMVDGLDQLETSPKYADFLVAGKKHGIKIILTLAVEEPAK